MSAAGDWRASTAPIPQDYGPSAGYPIPPVSTASFYASSSRSSSSAPSILRSLSSTPFEPSPPAVIISPTKKRRRGKSTYTLSDLDDRAAWTSSDEAIIGESAFSVVYLHDLIQTRSAASKSSWRSPAYSHYNISLQRELVSGGAPSTLTFVFTCKIDSEHKPHYRPRMKTSEGTTNLQTGIALCNARRGVRINSAQPSENQPLVYSVAGHRALIALHCARSNHPFNAICDEDYQREVQMLRPGTILPSPHTVSRDIRAIYIEMSKHVREYFKVTLTPFIFTFAADEVSY